MDGWTDGRDPKVTTRYMKHTDAERKRKKTNFLTQEENPDSSAVLPAELSTAESDP